MSILINRQTRSRFLLLFQSNQFDTFTILSARILGLILFMHSLLYMMEPVSMFSLAYGILVSLMSTRPFSDRIIFTVPRVVIYLGVFQLFSTFSFPLLLQLLPIVCLISSVLKTLEQLA